MEVDPKIVSARKTDKVLEIFEGGSRVVETEEGERRFQTVINPWDEEAVVRYLESPLEPLEVEVTG